MSGPRLAQANMHVNSAGRDDQPTCVNFLNFGSRTLDSGFGADDFSVGDVNIGKFIPLIRRVDHTAVANDGRAHIWMAHASGVLVLASRRNNLLPSIATLCSAEFQKKFASARTRALPRRAGALLTLQSLRTSIEPPCARPVHW